jgi:hypothetical protein
MNKNEAAKILSQLAAKRRSELEKDPVYYKALCERNKNASKFGVAARKMKREQETHV